MTQDEKNRTIEILEFHGAMIGNDQEECSQLIKQVRNVYCTAPIESVEDKITLRMEQLCHAIGYNATEDNNKSRAGNLVPMRDAITKAVMDEFDGYLRMPHALGFFFGKDRSTGIAMMERSALRFETKDKLFMYQYNKIAA